MINSIAAFILLTVFIALGLVMIPLLTIPSIVGKLAIIGGFGVLFCLIVSLLFQAGNVK